MEKSQRAEGATLGLLQREGNPCFGKERLQEILGCVYGGNREGLEDLVFPWCSVAMGHRMRQTVDGKIHI